METKTYEVPSIGIESVRTKLAKLNRRAVKLGMPEMELIIGEPIRREYWATETDLVKTVTVHYPVSVKGDYPVVDGWQMIAKINHDQGVNLIDIATDDDVSVWRERDPECDHCHQKRISVKSYLIKNVEDGTIMGVGSGCLKDFLPNTTDNMVRAFQFISTMGGMLSEESLGSWGGGAMLYSVYDVLRVANLCVRKSGWVPARGEGTTTVSRVWDGIERPISMGRGEAREWAEYYTLEETDGQSAVEFIAHHNAIEVKPDNNFGILLKQLVKLGAVEGKFIAHLTGALAAFRRWEEAKTLKEKEAARKADRKRVNDWVGSFKERRTFNVVLEGVFKTEGYYGVTTICKMLDDEGHALTWFSSAGGFDAEIGDEFTIKATVKDHSEFRDMKQTVVTRCTVVK